MLTQKDEPNHMDPTTVVLSNRRDTLFNGGKSTKIGGMCTMKHDIISPKFYEILIQIDIKGYTDLDLRSA